MLNILDIIDKKRNNQFLNREEIDFVINQYVENKIPDYQMSALLMAMCCNDLNQDEINYLTDAYIQSGETIDLSAIKKPTVDKHSTGGVGDKISLLIAPILACFDVDVAKMSGRGLGFTGGTLDKLEAIEGFNISLDKEQFINQVNNIGLSIISQTGNLVPADKKIYALRDVTGTIDSIGLIAASIMSKKIAAGAQNICLDIKCGSGAFMKDFASAKQLAKTLIRIGNQYNRNVCAVISSMEQPLGISIGNSIEVLEVIDTLKGNGPSDLLELAICIVKETLHLCGKQVSSKEIIELINEGIAYNKFVEFIVAQGGSIDAINNLTISQNSYEIKATTSGYMNPYNTALIGKAAQVLGAGRLEKTDEIDHQVGIKCFKKIGTKIEPDDILFTIYYNDQNKLEECIKYLEKSYSISENVVNPQPIILDVVR